MELFICIDKDNNLHSIEWDIERCREHKQISFSGGEYGDCIDEQTGTDNARERLEDPDYWKDIGFITKEFEKCSVLINNINWEGVAQETLDSDGWENTNGEYSYFGSFKDIDYYFNLIGCGQHYDFKNKNIKAWLIPQDIVYELLEYWDKYHIKKIDAKTFNKVFKRINSIFSEFCAMQDRQHVLTIYKNIEDIEQDDVYNYMINHVDTEYKWHIEALPKPNIKLKEQIIAMKV